MTATNRALLDRFHAAVNSRDERVVAQTIDELFEPDVAFHAPVEMGVGGARAIMLVWSVLLRAYPDIHVAVEDVIADGDKVVSRHTVTGTHLGEHLGVAPTGRAVSYQEIFVFRVADGRIAEVWGVVDVFAQLRQLGAIAGPPTPGDAAR
jgi:steroid delta-isomerase-like uncharacterized protein